MTDFTFVIKMMLLGEVDTFFLGEIFDFSKGKLRLIT
jgi:hypothetical protein